MNTDPRRIIAIHHRADFDGIFCREIAKKFLPPHTEHIGWDYGDPVPDVPAEAQLYMLDISIDGLLMEHPNLIWIDHHKSAIEKFSPNIFGYRIDGVAACRLAWQWFRLQQVWDPREMHPPYELPTKEKFVERMVDEPFAVRLAGEYDIWDKRDDRAELFQHGLRSQELMDADWADMLDPKSVMGFAKTVQMLLMKGRAVQYARTQENESIIKSAGFTVKFEGLIFLACNAARYNSQLFTAGVKPEHDALLGFNFDGKEWRVSLYHAPGQEHHDLSQIAVKHGGGGHRGACGFRMKTPDFLKGLAA